MLELPPYDAAFSRLTIPRELEHLALTGKQLLDAAHEEYSLDRDERNEHLKHFIDRPEAVQSLWEIEEPRGFYPSQWLAVNIVRDALILSIRSRVTDQDATALPQISAVIGNGYAQLSESDPVRAHHYDHELAGEHLEKFTDRLHESIAIIGLQYTLHKRRESRESIAA